MAFRARKVFWTFEFSEPWGFCQVPSFNSSRITTSDPISSLYFKDRLQGRKSKFFYCISFVFRLWLLVMSTFL